MYVPGQMYLILPLILWVASEQVYSQPFKIPLILQKLSVYFYTEKFVQFSYRTHPAGQVISHRTGNFKGASLQISIMLRQCEKIRMLPIVWGIRLACCVAHHS